MRRLLVILVLVGAATAAAVLTAASGGSQAKGKTYYIEFDNIFGLTEGGDLKVGGVRAGETPTFDVTKGEPVKALVTAKVTRRGFSSFRKDASCDIRQQSLIGEYYVDCQPGKAKEELKDGATIPVEQTSSTIPIDLVNNVMRRPYRERFRLIISELGAGLAGRPDDLAETLRRAHPGLRETSKTLRVLAGQNEIIKDFIRDSDTVIEELEGNKRDVVRFVKEAGETAEISASRRDDLQRQFNRLPVFLRELDPTMTELGRFADAQIPLLRDLRGAAPELRTFFEEIGPFSEASRPAFRSLGELGDVGREALDESREEIAQLRAVARNAPGLARPLRQLLVSLDKRERSIERDPRAATTAPPAPDPAAYKSGEGFTGMEAILNYFYWQTLTINSFDEVGHLLRVLGIESEECSPYSADPDAKHQEDCGSYLGDYQPGLEGQEPDPTEGGAARRASASRERGGDGDGAEGETGEDSKPARPRITLPPEVRELAEALRSGGGAKPKSPGAAPAPAPAPQAGGASDEKLLDYLLAP